MRPDEPKLYLTFDDGPVPEITPWVLDVLKQYRVTATFFCVGDNVGKHPQIYKRIIDEGHHVGNHTFNHLNGWNTDTAIYMANINKCAEVLNSSLFRPPYGKLKPSQVKRLKKQYKIIMWDVLSGDYDKETAPEQCLENVITGMRNGSIIVFHDSKRAFRNLQHALPKAIEFAQDNGYEFANL